MKYFAEIKVHWRPLLAATIGIGSGMSIIGMVTTVLAPAMIEDNGWSKADFAMIGSLGLISSIAFPFVGRMADTIGVRMTALFGQVAFPLLYLAYSMMSGSLAVYVGIFIVQSIACVTTTATVYTRLAVQFTRGARGMALAIVASGPAITGAIGGPLLNAFADMHGWRASYQVMAVFAAVAGLLTFALIPRESREKAVRTAPADPAPTRRADYAVIFRSPAFWLLGGAMLLCNLPQVIVLTQLKLVLFDNGVTGNGVAIMVSALSLGMLAGRFATGFALDHLPTNPIAVLTLGLPSIGLFLIASSIDAPAVLTFAVFCLGFSFGAEGDLVAYVVARQFGVRIYSSVMGLLTAVMSTSAAAGALLLSMVLRWTGGFDTFLVIAGTASVTGALLMLGLPTSPRALEQSKPQAS